MLEIENFPEVYSPQLSKKPLKPIFWMLTAALICAPFLPNATDGSNYLGDIQLASYAFAIAPEVIRVPEDHTRIQWAINNASEGATIMVKAGKYFESVIVNKTVSLIGENRDTTVLDGQGKGALFDVRTENVIISGFTLQNGYAGVWLYNAKNCTVSENNMKNNAYGIKLDNAGNSKIIRNNVNNSQWFGIVLDHSGNSTLQDNSMVGNRFNLRVDGDSQQDFNNRIDASNTVDGKPVYYLTNQRDLTIDSFTYPEIGYLAFVNSTNITAKNLNLENSGQGILFAHTTDSTISNVTVISNWNGIEVKAASNVTVIGNNANNNFDFGIKFEHSSSSIISRNNANINGWAGIGIFTSQNIVVNANIVNNNVNYGIDLVYSTNSVVNRNSVSNGIAAFSMVLYYSNFNMIYHNNFVNYFIYKPVSITNTWDNGLEGNFWSSYNGTDTDLDGIGDTPYLLEEGNQDNHTLMGRIAVFTATAEHQVITISNSTISNLQFDQANKIISFSASGGNKTKGFSRLRIPKALVGDSYTVLVNNRKPLTLQELPISNETYIYLYVTYSHSSASGAIQPDSLLVQILVAFLAVAVLAVIVTVVVKKGKIPPKAVPSQSDIAPSGQVEAEGR